MLNTVLDYVGLGAKPTGLPTRKGVAKAKALADREWPAYFGEKYFHRYWNGDASCPSGCTACGVIIGSFCVWIIGSLFALMLYNAQQGISLSAFRIWLGIVAVFPILSLGLPVVSTWWTRRKIYRKYFNEYSIERNWKQTISPILREMTIKRFDREIADLNSSLAPEQDALKKVEAQKSFVACADNPVSDRESSLKEIDKIIIERKAEIARIKAQIGDALVAKEMALGKILEYESHALRESHGDTMSQIDVIAVINNLASGAGLAPVAVPSEKVNQSILVDELLRGEIRKDQKPMPREISLGKEKS